MDCCLDVSVYVVRMCADSTTPSYFAVSCRLAGRVRGKRDLRSVSIIPLGSCSGGGLPGRTCCCRWLSLALLAISRMPCSVAVSGVMLPTVPNLRTHTQVRRRKNPGMERSGPALTAFRRAGWPGGNRRSTNCCSGAPLLLGCIALHSCACACLYLCGLRMCADSTCPFYLVVSGRLAGRSAG